MAYSYVRYTGNGSTTNYTFSFSTISTDHLKVRVNGTLVTNWSFLNSSTIQFVSAPAAAAVIEIRRETPKDSAIANFTDGSVLLERDLDLLATWQLYVAQETEDDLEDTIRVDSLGRFDVLNKRIINVADPVAAQDAVTKNWVETTYTPTVSAFATAAASSATASAGSATASANSATAAAASYDSFDDRYLGAKAVAPTVDNDGNALLVGATFWDSVSSQMFVWAGSQWKPTFLTGNAVRALIVSMASQTVFTVPTYVVAANTLQVFVNGVKVLISSDYVETNQNTITFASGLNVGDEVEAIALQPYAIGTTGAESVSFQQSGIGSILRTADAKLKEVVSRSDFNSDTNFNNAAVGRVSIDGSNKVAAPRFEGTATDDAGTPDAIFRVSRTHTGAGSPHSFRDQTVFSPTANGISACSFDAALSSAGSASMDHTIGFQARNVHNGTGTLNDMYGLGSYPIVNSGTVTNCIGLDIAPHSGAGTVVNEYGIYIRNQNTSATNKYPIFIPNSLGTNVIGAATNFNNAGVVSIGGNARLFLGDALNNYKSIAYNHNMQTNTHHVADQIQSLYFGATDITFRWSASGTAGSTPTFTNLLNIRNVAGASLGAVYPGANGTQKLGISGQGWSEVFASNGTINTSDARVKTEVRDLTDAELAASKQLSKEIGAFKFLAAVAKKGDAAREHIGMTVQRAIQIMKSHGLDAMAYSFICYDEWEAEYQDHPAIYEQVVVEPEQVEIIPSSIIEVKETVVIDGQAKEVTRSVEIPEQRRVIKEAVLGDGPVKQEAWREMIRDAGNTYGFRTDQLLMFIARGFEERLSALEQ